jgi:hypothetical protein
VCIRRNATRNQRKSHSLTCAFAGTSNHVQRTPFIDRFDILECLDRYSLVYREHCLVVGTLLVHGGYNAFLVLDTACFMGHINCNSNFTSPSTIQETRHRHFACTTPRSALRDRDALPGPAVQSAGRAAVLSHGV